MQQDLRDPGAVRGRTRDQTRDVAERGLEVDSADGWALGR